MSEEDKKEAEEKAVEDTSSNTDAEATVVQQAADKAAGEQKAEAEDKVEEAPAEPIEHTISGVIGRKLGMTQIFDKDGNFIPITVVEVGPCTVLELNDEPSKVTLGFAETTEKRTNKARMGFFKKAGVAPMKIVREFGTSKNDPYKVGQTIGAEVFKPGDYVDVSGTSIGKGFQGGMKRHGWSGGPAGHGSMHHRRVGSIGMSADPSKTLKGRTMPGQMGNKRVTTQGLRVMDVDLENNFVMLKGAVPGHKSGIVSVKLSRKKTWRDLNEVKAVVQHKVNPMKQSKAKAGAKKKGK